MSLDLHFAPEIGEPPDEAADGFGLVAAIEVKRAEVAILDAVAKHVVGRSEHGCGDCEDGFLGAASRFDAQELPSEVAVLLAGAGPGGGDEGGFQPGAALSHASRAPLARALIVTRAQAGPRDEMAGGGKARHVDADLRHDDLRDDVTHLS